MRPWLFLLGPFLLWGLHFGGVYAIASVFDVISEADAPGSRWSTAGFSLACLIAAVALGVASARGARRETTEARRWMLSLGAMGAALTAISVVWQGLPALIGY